MTDAYELTRALGGRWSGRHGIACCPAHEDQTPSLSLANGADGRLLLHCHAGCSFANIQAALRDHGLLAGTGTFRPISRVLQAQRHEAERAYEEKRCRLARRLWQETVQIGDTLAERYLRSRGITCTLPSTLRYIGDCWHSSGRRCPAMVALVDHLRGKERFGVHRTYLCADGTGKADLVPSKAMLGSVSGGAVHLSNGPGPLVITEGIETGLSLLSGLLDPPSQVWAALSAGGMEKLILPALPGDLIIAPDGDAVGRKAATALATRAHARGWRVSLLQAPEGYDWNDVLTGKAVAA